MKTIPSITLAGFVTLFSTASLLAGSHTVKSGDTLWSLSRAYKVSVEAIPYPAPEIPLRGK